MIRKECCKPFEPNRRSPFDYLIEVKISEDQPEHETLIKMASICSMLFGEHEYSLSELAGIVKAIETVQTELVTIKDQLDKVLDLYMYRSE